MVMVAVLVMMVVVVVMTVLVLMVMFVVVLLLVVMVVFMLLMVVVIVMVIVVVDDVGGVLALYTLDPGGGLGRLLKIEGSGTKNFLERNITEIALDDAGLGLDGADDVVEMAYLVGPQQ